MTIEQPTLTECLSRMTDRERAVLLALAHALAQMSQSPDTVRIQRVEMTYDHRIGWVADVTVRSTKRQGV